jgi:hypothetical protein
VKCGFSRCETQASAAKRRKNAAHGASRGTRTKTGQAPEERKKNPTRFSDVRAQITKFLVDRLRIRNGPCTTPSS